MPKKILIATPRKGDVPEEFVRFRSQLEHRQTLGEFPDYAFYFEFMGGVSVNMARNALAHHARCNGMDKLLFVDMDVLPTVENALRIVSHDVPVVGGIYMKRNGHFSWLGRHRSDSECDPKTGLVPYEDLPTGFLCIDVKTCLDVLVAKMPEIAFDAVDDPDAENLQYQTMHEFFPMGITGPSSWRQKFMDIREAMCDADSACYASNDAEWLRNRVRKILDRNTGPRIFRGEDYHFCWFCQQLGIPIYADWQCFIHHKGTAVYPLDPNFVLNLANKITAKAQERAATETKA